MHFHYFGKLYFFRTFNLNPAPAIIEHNENTTTTLNWTFNYKISVQLIFIYVHCICIYVCSKYLYKIEIWEKYNILVWRSYYTIYVGTYYIPKPFGACPPLCIHGWVKYTYTLWNVHIFRNNILRITRKVSLL